MRFQCQQCSSILELDDCQPGELVECDRCGAAVPVPDTPTSPRAILGEFAIKREIGAGGMGTVYLAHQITLDRDVALKVLMPSFCADTDFINSFINEARSAAAINHPNIIQAYSVKNDGPIWYFAMEYIDGPTVKTLLEQNGRIPVEQALTIAGEIVSALRYAWNERQIIHRDLKPDNIMINSSGHAKLADLGLARKCSDAEGASSELYGTPQYIAPELLLTLPANAQSDIYSLGATFYHMLTGQFPFDADTSEDLVMKHLVEPLVPIRQRMPDIPEAFATLVENMMAKRPAQRYQSYDELYADIERVAQGNMPTRKTDPTSQIPIDFESADPLAIPTSANAPAQHPAGKKKLMKLNASAPAQPVAENQNADAQQPDTENVEGEAENNEAENGEDEKPKSIRGLVIAIVAILVLLIGGAAGWYFTMGNASQPTDDTQPETAENAPAEATENNAPAADGETPAADAAQQPRTIDQLKQLVQMENDQAFDEMNKLLAENHIPKEELFNVLSPLYEKRVQAGRTPLIDESHANFSYAVNRIKKERQEKEEKERLEAEEAERKKAEEEKAERERKEKEEKIARIKEGKQQKLNKMHKDIARRFFPSAGMIFQDSFDDEDEELTTWRKSWKSFVDAAEKLNNMMSGVYIGANSTYTLPVYVAYKDKKDVESEDDKYTTVPMRITGFDGKNVTFTASNAAVIKVQPKLQQRRYKKEHDGEMSFSVPVNQLLPDQQIAIAQAVLKESQNSDVMEDAIPALVAASLLVNGNFLNAVLESPVFADFRSNTPFIDTLKENKEELEFAANQNLAQEHAEWMGALLEEAAKAPNSIKAKTIENTLRRSLDILSKSYGDVPEELKDTIAKFKKLN